MTAAIPLLLRAGASAAATTVATSRMGGDEPGGEGVPGADHIGDGHYMFLPDQLFKDILHSTQVVDAITARAVAVRNACMAMAYVPGAEYEVIVQNWPDSTRARAFVRPANYAAVRDDARNSTMLKAAATVPNDPKPSGGNLVGGGTTGNPISRGAGVSWVQLG